jgi:CRISPR/Cas system CSM-associated protein Csm2 small subunit
MRTRTYEEAELAAASTNLQVALTKLRRLLEETDDRDLAHRVRGVVIKLDDTRSALERC